MSFDNVFADFNDEIKHQSLLWGADPNLRALVFARIREIDSDIADLKPNDVDPVVYIRHAHDLHARKEELQELFNLMQSIKLANQPQPKE